MTQSSRRTVGRKQVASAAPGPDDVLTAPGRQLGAEPSDVNVDHVGQCDRTSCPTRARRCPLRVMTRPARRAMNSSSAYSRVVSGSDVPWQNATCARVSSTSSPTSRRSSCGGRLPRRASARSRARSSPEVERLEQIVVGAAVEAGNPRVDRVTRGQDQDRRRRARRPQLPAESQAVSVGKAEVQDDQIVIGVAGRARAQRGGCARRRRRTPARAVPSRAFARSAARPRPAGGARPIVSDAPRDCHVRFISGG